MCALLYPRTFLVMFANVQHNSNLFAPRELRHGYNQAFWNFVEKIGKLHGTYKKLHSIARHYESTVKMAFFICFHSVLAVFASILLMSLLGIWHVHCVLKISACSLGTNLWKIDGNRHGTRKYCVFNRSSSVFSGKNRNVIYPILKYSTKCTSYFIMYVFFFLLLSRDFVKFYWLHGPAQFLSILWNHEIPEGHRYNVKSIWCIRIIEDVYFHYLF